jgi:ubiquinone/menaquinone biosynthesis C-methylase UbiE
MTEERKQTEIEHYDKKATEWLESSRKEHGGDFEGFSPFLLSSYKFLQEYLKDKCKGKKILDYGCGNGVHYTWLVKLGGEVVGIDLSEKSLEVARKTAEKEGIGEKAKFLLMDCEKLEFPDNYFDIIFDGGSFSSLDLNKAYPELSRVLAPEGFLVGIETFGHNPFTNLKRRLNKATGKRTKWAASHIFQNNDIKKAENFFGKEELFYFHLVSWIVFPFLKIPGSAYALKLFEGIDRILLNVPFLRKYSFKVVFVFSKPKK